MATIQSMYTYELWRQVNTIFHIPRRACAAKLILHCVANVCMECRQKRFPKFSRQNWLDQFPFGLRKYDHTLQVTTYAIPYYLDQHAPVLISALRSWRFSSIKDVDERGDYSMNEGYEGDTADNLFPHNYWCGHCLLGVVTTNKEK